MTVAQERLRVWLRLFKTTRAIEGELRDRLRREFDTTLPRFDVMSALSRAPDGLKMSELSRMLMVSNGNVTGIVDRLADDGLLLREPVPGDRRAALVRLTEAGRTDFARQAEAHARWLNELLSHLSPDDCATLIETLSRKDLAHAL